MFSTTLLQRTDASSVHYAENLVINPPTASDLRRMGSLDMTPPGSELKYGRPKLETGKESSAVLPYRRSGQRRVDAVILRVAPMAQQFTDVAVSCRITERAAVT